ncbi:MAG: hypothetical protein DWI57_02770 [Chloroflexi bacterium]|nr:MAG: hypothetical protein DWI57_02770 [Chloroflexota bacterium]
MAALLNPTLLLAVLLAIGYASLFHLWTGRSLRDLFVYLAAAGVGVIVGQWIGGTIALDLLRIGQLHTIEVTVGAFLALLIVRTFEL